MKAASLPPLCIVVGGGGVGKTTLAAALGVLSSEQGARTLVMTFDPSRRLRDALGIGDEARERETVVEGSAGGRLSASLLDERRTFDRLVRRYAPDAAAADRILDNRFYRHLGGSLAGILEYMAVERLLEVWRSQRYDRILLDTPPTRQALDFLEAPRRIVDFLDSGVLQLALRPWFGPDGGLLAAARYGPLGRRLERTLDELVGLDLLQEMAEFFHAFAPLFGGFRRRAVEVEELLRSPMARYILVVGPGEARVPEALFFARRLDEAGYRLGSLVVNRLHPRTRGSRADGAVAKGLALMGWLGERDARGVTALRALVGSQHPIAELPLLSRPPSSLSGLRQLAELLDDAAAVAPPAG